MKKKVREALTRLHSKPATDTLTEDQFAESMEIRDSISDLVSQIEDSNLCRQEKIENAEYAIKMLTELKDQL